MFYYEIEDLYFEYDWNLKNIDIAFKQPHPGEPFNKKNGYQILYFLNEVILKLGSPDLELARMAEKLLNTASEHEVNTFQKAEHFILAKWSSWV